MRKTFLIALGLLATSPAGATPPLTEPNLMAAEPATYRRALQAGGPGKDGIPSIDEPTFYGVEEADEFLDPGTASSASTATASPAPIRSGSSSGTRSSTTPSRGSR